MAGIVVKNDFTNKNEPKYNMGKTPGRFVVDYAARTDATEPLNPLESEKQFAELRLASSIYNKRDMATKKALHNGEEPRYLLRKLQKSINWNGRTFGNRSISYSSNELHSEAKKIQRLWNKGHSVNKGIISFDVDYLKHKGVIDPNFHMSGRGALFGHVDQLKLRQSISNGINQMTQAGDFTKPIWIASIQLDTLHPHCHFILADDVPLAKSNRLIKRCYQNHSSQYHLEDRGKLTASDRTALSQTVDNSLNADSNLRQYQAQPVLNKSNVLSHVDELAALQISTNGKLQEILTSLPADAEMWSMSNQSTFMKHSNHLMDDYLNDLVQQHGNEIGYQATIDNIYDHSIRYQKRHNLSNQQRKSIYRQNIGRFHNQMGNLVYRQLKQVVKSKNLLINTPYLQAITKTPHQLKSDIYRSYQGHQIPNIQMEAFAYRLNDYPKRYRSHFNHMNYYHDALSDYIHRERHGRTNRASMAMYRFYNSEFNYHAGLVDKYRFLFMRRASDRLAVSQMSLHRSQLLLHRHQLSKLMFKSPLDLTVGESRLLKDMSTDSKLARIRQIRINTSGMTLGRALKSMRHNQSVSINETQQHNLETFFQMSSRYSGLKPVFHRMSRIRTNGLERGLIRDYSQDLEHYTFNGLKNGTLNALNYQEYHHTYHQILTYGDIPVPPKPMTRSKNLTSRVFNRVKSDDISDMLFDLSPDEDRSIDDNDASHYQELTEHRLLNTMNAQRYLQQSQQANESLNLLMRRLMKQEILANKVRKTHRLPVKPVSIINKPHHLGRSISNQDAYQYTRENIDSFHHLTNRVNNSIDHNNGNELEI